jgi:hypothetical protein
MRTTINLSDDAALAARNVSRREQISLGEAISRLIRRGMGGGEPAGLHAANAPTLRGRFALLPARDEVVTPQHVRDLMEREGI